MTGSLPLGKKIVLFQRRAGTADLPFFSCRRVTKGRKILESAGWASTYVQIFFNLIWSICMCVLGGKGPPKSLTLCGSSKTAYKKLELKA